jgi:hypothetical protein
VLTLYAEGHSLADFLIQKSDKPTYLKFLQTAHENGWQTALKPFGYDSIESLESEWDQWVLAGNPDIKRPDGSQLADNRRQAPRNPTTIRGQSPDSEKPTRESSPAADKGSPPGAIAVSRPLSRDQLQSPVFVQPLINQSGAARIPHEAPKHPRFNE